MKKTIICFISIFAACMSMNAQSLAFGQGSSRLDFGLGIPNIAVGQIEVPSLFALYEYGVVDFGNSSIGIGGDFEYAKTSGNQSVSGEVFGKYHYNFTDRLDLDGHIGIGYGAYGIVKTFVSSIGIGINYKFSDGIGVFGNLGTSSLPGKAVFRGGFFFQF